MSEEKILGNFASLGINPSVERTFSHEEMPALLYYLEIAS